MTVRSAVETSLKAVGEIAGRDAGTAELARNYARLIDGAQPTAALARAIRTVTPHIDFDDDKVCDAWRKITEALAKHSVASDLGPKLLASLDALMLTPRSRAGGNEKGGQTGAPVKPKPLDQLADRRARKGRTADLHSPTP